MTFESLFGLLSNHIFFVRHKSLKRLFCKPNHDRPIDCKVHDLWIVTRLQNDLTGTNVKRLECLYNARVKELEFLAQRMTEF